MKISAFMAVSLDGFIAKEDGGLDWLASDCDFGYQEYMSGIDVVVVGRKSFEQALTFDEWPYSGKEVIVLSRSMDDSDLPKGFSGNIRCSRGVVRALVEELKKNGRKGVYVDGGMAVSSFLRHKLLDEIAITHVPVLLSKGVRLFSDTGDETRMRLISTHPYQNGFVHSVYKVEK